MHGCSYFGCECQDATVCVPRGDLGKVWFNRLGRKVVDHMLLEGDHRICVQHFDAVDIIGGVVKKGALPRQYKHPHGLSYRGTATLSRRQMTLPTPRPAVSPVDVKRALRAAAASEKLIKAGLVTERREKKEALEAEAIRILKSVPQTGPYYIIKALAKRDAIIASLTAQLAKAQVPEEDLEVEAPLPDVAPYPKLEEFMRTFEAKSMKLTGYKAAQVTEIVAQIEKNDARDLAFRQCRMTPEAYKADPVNAEAQIQARLDEIRTRGRGRPAKLSLREQVAITLAHIRHGWTGLTGSLITGVPVSTFNETVTKIAVKILGAMKRLFQWGRPDEPISGAHAEFMNSRNIAIVIDATESFVNKPRDTPKQKAYWSRYKHHWTIKHMVGISPGGRVIFVSDGFPGGISDTRLVKRSGLLDILPRNSAVLADKGYLYTSIYRKMGIKLVTPPRKSKGKGFTEAEILKSRRVSSARIFVECMIRGAKINRILTTTVSAERQAHFSRCFQIAAWGTNFKAPFKPRDKRRKKRD